MARQQIPVVYELLYSDRAAYDAALVANGGSDGVYTRLTPVDAAATFPGYTSLSLEANSFAGNLLPWTLGLGPSSLLTDSGNYIELNSTYATAISVSYTPLHQLFNNVTSIDTTQNSPPDSQFAGAIPVTIFWLGYLVFQGVSPQPPTPTPTNSRYLGKRRWIDGFEIPQNGEGTSGSASQWFCRDASRTAEGLGYAYRNSTVQMAITMPAGATNPAASWERFYLRIRTLPVGGDDSIWSPAGTLEGSGDSVILTVTTTGTLKAYNCGNAAYPGHLMGTTAPLTVGVWYRIDLRVVYRTGVSIPGAFSLYLNGTLSLAAVPANSVGLDVNTQVYATGQMGMSAWQTGGTSHGLECDMDDWINAEEPTIVGTPFPGMDLASGSHVLLVRPSGFGPSQGTHWTGDWREVNQLVQGGSGVTPTAKLTSSTVSQTLDVTTDYVERYAGCAAFTVGAWYGVNPAGNVQIGWASTGAPGNVLLTLSAPSPLWVTTASAIYSVASGTTSDAIPAVTDLRLQIITSASAGATTINCLFGAAEYLGVFGAEDNDPTAAALSLPPYSGIHNAPYVDPSTVLVQPPLGVVSTFAGTYTGNDLAQDVMETIPAHFWWVRPLTGGSDGVAWYSSMDAAHGYLAETMVTEGMSQAQINSNNQALVRPSGTAAAANANAVTYAWFAVSDMAFRYLLNGSFSHKSSVTTADNALIDPTFTPDASFFFVETLGTVATTGHYYKGPGHTGTTASPLDATVSATVATFAEGLITSKATIHSSNPPQTAFAAFRKDDGSGSAQWYDIDSYTGDGSGARDIPCVLNGRKPAWVLVVPHNGGAYFRDPSHTGTHSSKVDSLTDSTTAITAVSTADQFSVDTTLNGNNVIYDFIVFPLGGTNQTGGVVTAPLPRPTAGPFPPTPPVVKTFALRRLRRFSLPFEQNLRTFLQRIEFLVQAGVGLTPVQQGQNAEIMVRFSRDGGKTYGAIYRVSAGKIGDYDHRTFLNRLGQGRNWVVEVTTTDPVFCALIDCFVDMERGSN